MILKWETLDGAWCVIDGVLSVDNHGYRSSEVIHKMAELYDGNPVLVHNTRRPTMADTDYREPISDDEPENASLYLAITFKDSRGREHWRFPDIRQGFLMSDDGKTIDRLLH